MPAPRPRPSGGFNQGLGQFNDNFGEHLDENAMQAAVQQKALAQQGTSSAQPAAQIAPGQPDQSALGSPEPAGVPTEPRELGTVQEELLQRPAHDIVEGLKSFFDIYSLLEINPETDDPQTQAHKKQMLDRWQRLNQEQQQVAQEKYQFEMKKKQEEEARAQQLEQQRQAAAHQTLNVPSGPRKGPNAQGAPKPRAVQKLEEDRKTLGGPQNVG
jgi:hypothetical protein